jgi:HPP family
VIIPFATSIVLVVGLLQAEPVQPRALIGGHVVATLVGLAVLHLTGPQTRASAAAVGLAVLAMYVTGTFHPPAGINPCRWPNANRYPLRLKTLYGTLTSSLRFRSSNRSPSRLSTTLRWWKASSVERWPIETMVVAGNFFSISL